MTGSVAHLVRQGFKVYLRPYWREQLVLGISIVPSVVLTTVLPLCLAALMDQAIPHHDRQLFLKTVCLVVMLLGLATCFETLEAFLRAGFGYEIQRDLRQLLFARLQQLPLSFHDQVQPGEIPALFARELSSVKNAYRDLVVLGGKAALQVFGYLIVMWHMSWQGTLAMIAIIPFIARHEGRSLLVTEKADAEDKMQDARVAFAVQDQMMSLPLVRAFGLSQAAVESFGRRVLGRVGLRRTLNNYDRAFINETFASPAYLKASMTVNYYQNIFYALALLSGGALAYYGFVSVGKYSALLVLVQGIGNAVGLFSAFMQRTITAASALERIEKVLNWPVPKAGDISTVGPLEGRVRFDQVSFGYSSQLQLTNLSFELQPRSLVAIVGRSGGGKSTILRLLLGLYPVASGRVLVDDYEVARLGSDALQGQVGVVNQELFLLNASVRENMLLAKPDATAAELEKAARAAEVHDFIMQLPQKYDTVVGEGGRLLSPGQRQRLALARAMLCNPRLLLLDEVTSALDPETEAAIFNTLRELSRQRTVVLVTHRLAYVTMVDQVLVIEKGQLAQQGTHQALLLSPGPYRQQWRAQSGFTISQDGRHAEVALERLRAIPLFEELATEVLERLVHRFKSDHFEPGEPICSEGQAGDRFFIIVRGRARVMAQAMDPEPIHVATLEDGDYFGEDALLDQASYSTTVIAEHACLVLVLHRNHFLQLMGDSTRVLQSLQDTAVGRSLTLFGRRGRRPSRIPATWDQICG